MQFLFDHFELVRHDTEQRLRERAGMRDAALISAGDSSATPGHYSFIEPRDINDARDAGDILSPRPAPCVRPVPVEPSEQAVASAAFDAVAAAPEAAMLKERFLIRAAACLEQARQRVGLHGCPSAGTAGDLRSVSQLSEMSLGQFIDLALQCETVPLDLKLAPVQEVCELVAEEPHAPIDALAFARRQNQREVRRALTQARRR